MRALYWSGLPARALPTLRCCAQPPPNKSQQQARRARCWTQGAQQCCEARRGPTMKPNRAFRGFLK